MQALTLRGYLAILAAVFLLGAGGYVVAKLMGWRLHVAEGQRDTARDDAQGRALEGQGRDNIAAKTQEGQDALDAQRRAAEKLNNDARNDPAANGQLPPSSLDRLRAGDRELCGGGRVKCPQSTVDGK